MDIEIAVTGRLGADPEKRISKAGKPWVRLAVACGDGAWLSIAAFGDLVDIADKIERGTMVYCEGALQVRQGDNGKVYLNVVASRIEALGRIGKRRPEKAGDRQALPAENEQSAEPAGTLKRRQSDATVEWEREHAEDQCLPF